MNLRLIPVMGIHPVPTSPFRAHEIAQPLADAIQQAAEEAFVKADRNYLRVMHNVSAPDADCDDAFEARERAGSFAHDADHVAALVEHILSKREG